MEIWRTRHAVAGSMCLIQLHPQCHAYNTWAFIQDGRLLTKTELLPWAFKDGRLRGRLIK